MNVLMISSDRKIFEPDSSVRRRMVQYGNIFDQLHIIVLTKHSQGYTFSKLSDHVWVYPTQSRMKLDYVYDAVRLVRHDLVIQGDFTPDVVSAQDPFESGLVGWLIARRYKRKLQLQIHTDLFDPYFVSRGILNRFRLLLARFLLPRAQCIRVVSERTKGELEKRYPALQGRVVVLPVYVDIERYRKEQPTFNLHLRYPQYVFIILMVSRLTPEKELPFAVEVLAGVLAHYSKAGLIIVGDGPEKKHILRRAIELGVAHAVVIEPWQDDLVSHYKTANLFLLTSRYEGYGMVLVEAAVSGMPIVSSDVGIARQLTQARGDSFVCPVGDKACFVAQIIDYIGNPERRAFSKLNQDDDLQGIIFATQADYLAAYRAAMEMCFGRHE